MTSQLDGQVAGEAAGVLDQHDSNLIGVAVGQQFREARPVIDGVRP